MRFYPVIHFQSWSSPVQKEGNVVTSLMTVNLHYLVLARYSHALLSNHDRTTTDYKHTMHQDRAMSTYSSVETYLWLFVFYPFKFVTAFFIRQTRLGRHGEQNMPCTRIGLAIWKKLTDSIIVWKSWWIGSKLRLWLHEIVITVKSQIIGDLAEDCDSCLHVIVMTVKFQIFDWRPWLCLHVFMTVKSQIIGNLAEGGDSVFT